MHWHANFMFTLSRITCPDFKTTVSWQLLNSYIPFSRSCQRRGIIPPHLTRTRPHPIPTPSTPAPSPRSSPPRPPARPPLGRHHSYARTQWASRCKPRQSAVSVWTKFPPWRSCRAVTCAAAQTAALWACAPCVGPISAVLSSSTLLRTSLLLL